MSSSRQSYPGNRSNLPSILFLLIVFSAKIHYTKPMEVFFTMSILFLEYPPCSTCQKAIALLATDGMLVKRPLVIGDSFVLTGFKEKDWQEKLG